MSDLAVRAARKAFGPVPALDGAELTVRSGTLVTVLGPSGCGKTTLLRCVAGFERLDAGEIRVGDRVVAGPGLHLAPHRRRVAVVPQDGALFPHLSVAGNVAYGLDRAARRADRVAEVLALVGLDGYQDRMPHQLSGGQQQRVAVARALAPRPPLVLLDEPFAALDATLRAGVRRDVRAALRADGATAVLVTHDQAEALSMADEVAVMRAGRVVQSGPPAEVYRAPADPWVAGFVGEAVLVRAAVEGSRAHTPLGEVPLGEVPLGEVPPGEVPNGDSAVTAFLRPEQLQVLPAGTPGAVAATVLRRDFHGHDALVLLALEDGQEVSARVFDPGQTTLAVGDQVALRVRGHARAFPALPAGEVA
jgi:iron(III) transport system ATP-binding protein